MEVDNYPEGEKKEMIEIYMEKGMAKKMLFRWLIFFPKIKKPG
jgi:hypothetical protein